MVHQPINNGNKKKVVESQKKIVDWYKLKEWNFLYFKNYFKYSYFYKNVITKISVILITIKNNLSLTNINIITLKTHLAHSINVQFSLTVSPILLPDALNKYVQNDNNWREKW